MKQQNQDKPADAAELRRLAEERLKARASTPRSEPALSRVEGLPVPRSDERLVHELQVHQIELEMQNEQLQQARAKADALLAQYTDLYDFAPTGYLTLDREGAIRQVNLTGTLLLGVERSKLANRRFGQFVAEGDRRVFSDFLEKVFASEAKTSCEVTLPKEGSQPLVVWIEGGRTEDGQECRAAVLDITERKQTEDALCEEHERLENVLSATRTGIDIIDGDFNLHFVDRGWQKVYGDPTGRKCYEYFNGFNAPCPNCGIRKALETKQAVITEEVLPREGNRPIEVRSLPFQNAKGQWLVAEVNIDITERKRAEEALRRYQMAVEQSSDGIAIADMDGLLTFVNAAWARMHGYEATEMLGQPLSINHTPEQVEREVISFNDAVREKGAQMAEIGHRRKDGSTLPTWMTGTLLKDNRGNRVGLVGIARDITEQKQAERERLRLTTAVEQASDAVVITDHEGAIQYVNPAFEKVTGYTRAEALGQNPRLLKSGKHDAEFYRRMWAVLAAGEVWSSRMTNKRKEGTLYEEDATISPVRDTAGKVVNYVAVKRDVTHEVQLEDQLRQAQKMESVGRLAGGVAHDFNNLLMGIMGYTQLCLDKVAPDHPIREYLDEITHDAERSAEITRQLLAFARKQTIAPKVLDLNDAVAGMLKLLRRLIGEDIKLAWRPGTDLRPVKLDPSQVDQILANLCVNARDAVAGVGEVTLETGSIAIDAEYCAKHPEAIPGAYVVLAVSDNGCGMDKETLAQVFEPFFTTKGLGKGTGLGLATVYGIVKQNNGFIYAYSEPGKGTTFKIYLPEIAAETVATTVTGKAEAPRGRGETILLVEDEKSLRVTCGAFLDALGYKVMVAETPGEALKMVAGHPGGIHVLLTDVVMPGMDGRQLAKRLAAVKPGVKVLFMSGYTSDVITQRGVLDEGVQFLAKPFTRDDLARKVRELLEAD